MSYEFKLDVEHTVIEVVDTGGVDFKERMQAIKEGVTILQDRDKLEVKNNAFIGEFETYKGYRLHSAFQPIISVPHRRAVGFEGLVRPYTDKGEKCSPFELFKLPQSSEQHLELDRQCRRLHMKNFARQCTSNEWLFINLDLQCLALEKAQPGFMEHLFSLHDISPHRVVVEILESEIHDRNYLKSLIKHFRAMGCLIAIDDFGAGHSNFERIWELEPDIVKLDRKLIQRAATTPKIKRILTGMVSLIHEAGSLVIIEGVETEKEAAMAIAVDADMVQGFYFARPSATINLHNQQLDSSINRLIQLQLEQGAEKSKASVNHFSHFKSLFNNKVHHFNQLEQFECCASSILTEKNAVRCFLLDDEGNQLGNSIHSTSYQQQFDDRFLPLLSGEHANWSHKPYHHRAVSFPDQLQMTRPYLSVAGAHMCITLSKAVEIDGDTFVFCCDISWQDD
jgi:EAL domain-containing protein (putative c-di-GMP-specific phosphodiesterase class I)